MFVQLILLTLNFKHNVTSHETPNYYLLWINFQNKNSNYLTKNYLESPRKNNEFKIWLKKTHILKTFGKAIYYKENSSNLSLN